MNFTEHRKTGDILATVRKCIEQNKDTLERLKQIEEELENKFRGGE